MTDARHRGPYKRWTTTEIKAVVSRYEAGEPAAAIAADLGATKRAVLSVLRRAREVARQ